MAAVRAILTLALIFTITVPYSLSSRVGLRSGEARAQGVFETRSRIDLDAALYRVEEDCVRVHVRDLDENENPQAIETVEVHVRTMAPGAAVVGDQETLLAIETGPATGEFFTDKCLPLVEAEPQPGDEVLQAQKGDLIGAAYVDEDNPAPPQGTPDDPVAELMNHDLAADLALVAGGEPDGSVVVDHDPAVLPPGFESTPGEGPNEPERPLALAVAAGGFPVLFGEDQVMMAPLDDTDLQRFLQRWNGSVVGELEIPGDGPNDLPESFSLIRVDPALLDGSELPYLAQLSGVQGQTTVSSDRAAGLLALLMVERLSGTNVMLSPVPWALAMPSTNEGGLDGMAQTDWRSTRAAEGVAFMDLIDRNTAGAVRLAVIGGGFASAADYPSGLDNPDWGQPFGTIRQASCGTGGCSFGPGMASGPMPLPCAGGGGGNCDWHETLAYGIAGAVGNNGSGTMGVAGHAREPSGADGASAVVTPVLLRIDAPYFGTVASAINAAVDDGVDVINISGGFACEPVGDIDLCSGATRFAIGAACGAITVLFGSILPGIGELVSLAGCSAIFALVGIAGLNRRGPLRAAVARASGAGVFIAASGTETVTAPVLGALGPWDAVDIEFLPCVLPGVTCVGASNAGAPDAINPNGRGLDIWAPVTMEGTVTPNNEPSRTTFSGTSAAAPFIAGTAALMKAANPGLSASGIETLLRDTSTPLTAGPLGGCVLNSSGVCTGVVDVLGALQAATGIFASCTSFEEGTPGNDTRATSDPVSVPAPAGPGEIVRVEVSSDGGLHALPGDQDWFHFSLPGVSGTSLATRVNLSIGMPAFGVPSMELCPAGSATCLSGPSAETFLPVGVDHHVHVTDSGNPALDDNCYNGSTLAIEVMSKPADDVCELNESELEACAPAGGWDDHGFLCSPRFPRERSVPAGEDCASVFEDFAGTGAPVSEAHVFWEYDLADLSLDTTADQDFYRVPVPDPADPADGGYDDVSPAGSSFPEALQDCSYYTRQGPLGSTINVSTGGRLYVKVVPGSNATSAEAVTPLGEEVRLYGAADTSSQPLLAIVDCPQRDGLEELLFSFGERSGLRDPFGPGGYEIEMTYHIPVTRDIPRDIIDRYDPPIAPMPCLNLGLGLGGGLGGPSGGGFAGFIPNPTESFPFCGDFLPGGFIGPVMELPHPIDPARRGCENGGGPACREIFPFDWPETGRDLRLGFASGGLLEFVLRDAQGEEMGRAVPLDPVDPINLEVPRAELLQALWIPGGLEPGRYFLEVAGPASTYAMTYEAPLDDADADRIDLTEDNCREVWNPDQLDADQNQIGDLCECGDQTGDGRVDVSDILAINEVIFDARQQSPLCDTNEDGLCNVSDILGVNAKIFGAPAYCSSWPSDPR